jgi:hypothetical protein
MNNVGGDVWQGTFAFTNSTTPDASIVIWLDASIMDTGGGDADYGTDLVADCT